MHPTTRKALAIEIENRLFEDESVCYYQFYVDLDFLDFDNNDYNWKFTYERLTSVKAVIGNGKDLTTTSESVNVQDLEVFAFKVTKSPQIFVSFTGDKAKRKDDEPSFKIVAELITEPKTTAGDELEEEITDEK